MRSEKVTICPFCGMHNELVSEVAGEAELPDDGDFSFCYRCGEWAVFDASWSAGVRKPSFAEYQELVAEPYADVVRVAWLAARALAKNPHLLDDDDD